ncbi:hypothetical protein ERX55_10580 [Macrococcus bovicus]|uniref:Uncharacterized protein n=2 Tax=Macrococcus bovicus TaxID=69968 RepID=A0A4R6BWU5_9STAP|nr:hypothetical protein ERX55_10580 [Macrococcus bovicus]
MIEDNLEMAERYLHAQEAASKVMKARPFFSMYELEQLEEDYGAPDRHEYHDHESGVAYWEEI